MDKSASSASVWGQVVSVQRGDRWSVNRRLKELDIACACPADGTLRVDVKHAVELMLVNSVVRRFTVSRPAGAAWLERC